MYTLTFTKDALEDIAYLKRSGNKPILRKLAVLLQELKEHPFSGTGQPEELKHNFAGCCWSRRLSSAHRLVYRVEQNRIVVVLFACDHYMDK